MSLRRRVTLLFVAVLLGFGLLAAAALALRETRLRERQQQTLVDTQRLVWEAEQSTARAHWRDRLDSLTGTDEWHAACAADDEAALTRLADATLEGEALQIDRYGQRRELLFSTSTALTAVPLVDAGSLERLGSAPASVIAGLRLLDRTRVMDVLAQRQPDGTVVAIGGEVRPRLDALAAALKSDAWVVSPRGRLLGGTREPAPALAVAVRTGVDGLLVDAEEGGDGAPRWHLVAHPLPGLDGREVARLVTARDATGGNTSDSLDDLVLATAAAAALAAMLLAVTLTLRRTLEPLGRTVAVVDALAAGELHTQLDDGDRVLTDEAGRLARAVERLRGELLSLGTLREERSRVSQQQERLIRGQLRALAETLDESERAAVLSRLEDAPGATGAASVAGAAAEPPLARLADVLGRLTGMVGSQQARLLDLLRELRAALETKALFASLQQELEIARRMQRAILPRQPPDTRAATLAARMIPAREVGGDFYDWFLIDPQRLVLVVADVSGKGVPAAFFMAVARTLLKSNAPLLREPGRVVERLNAQLCEDNEQTMFVTLFYAVLDLHSGELCHVNAGHNPPLLRRRDGRVEWLARGTNPALAVIDDVRYREARVQLAPGDELLLYTDGVTEATDAQGALFGEAALQAVAAAAPGAAARPPGHAGGSVDDAADTGAEVDAPAVGDTSGMIDRVVRAVRRFEAGAPQADDITCVWLRYDGGGSAGNGGGG